MPNFTIAITGGAQVPWTDPASEAPAAPSRLHPDPIHPHTYRRIQTSPVAPDLVVQATITATVDGVAGPMDVDLGGDTFTGAWATWCGTAPPPIEPQPGQSSVMVLSFTGHNLGHHVFRMTRKNGGIFLVHLDVEAF